MDDPDEDDEDDENPERRRLALLGSLGESRYVSRPANGGVRITYVRWATPIHGSR